MIVTRASNNYGPYQFPEKVIPLFITNALDDIPVPLYGDGLNERDWLHVSDHCRALDRLIDDGQSGEVYNIGGGNNVRNIDLTRDILVCSGKPESLIRPVADRPGHDRRYCLDTAKVRSLGWEPQRAVRARVWRTPSRGTAQTNGGGARSSRTIRRSAPTIAISTARAGPDRLPCLVHRWSRERQDLRAAISSITCSSTTSASRPGATLCGRDNPGDAGRSRPVGPRRSPRRRRSRTRARTR